MAGSRLFRLGPKGDKSLHRKRAMGIMFVRELKQAEQGMIITKRGIKARMQVGRGLELSPNRKKKELAYLSRPLFNLGTLPCDKFKQNMVT